MSTLQRRDASGATLAYLVAWARRNPAALREYVAAHGEYIELCGRVAYNRAADGSRVYDRITTGWQGNE